MEMWLKPPINMWMAGGLAGVALAALVLSLRRFGFARRQAGDLTAAQWLVRALRWLIIGLTAAAWAAGFLWGQSWLLIIGLVILSQELYEGFILSAALRTGRRVEKGASPFG
jgi:hypothetical protein